jgi:hypothetical protein
MTDFKVRRGLSTAIFSEPGVVNPLLIIEEGCWYLCTDTAELFVGVIDENKNPTLKKINDTTPSGNKPSFGPAFGELEDDAELFKRISSEDELPSNFEAEDFNPNTTYYIPILEPDGINIGRASTFIFDKNTQSYLCTNSIDEQIIRVMVASAIDVALDAAITEKLPNVVRQTLESTILCGGNASSGVN